jgi:hypothetical protein
MGLLSEIERVWVAIDHKLFLWDYMEGCVSSLSLLNTIVYLVAAKT